MRWGGSKLVSEAVWCNSRHAHYKYVVTYRLQREAAQTSREVEAVPSAPPAGVAHGIRSVKEIELGIRTG